MVCGGLGVLVYRYDDVRRPHVEKVLDGAWDASWRGDLSLGFHHVYSIIFWWTALKILTVYERRSGTTLSGGGSPRGTDRRRGIRHLEFETGQSHLLGKRSERILVSTASLSKRVARAGFAQPSAEDVQFTAG